MDKIECKIGDRVFDVVCDKNCDSRADTSGTASDWYQKIWLTAGDRKTDGVMSDFWHEVFEMVVSIYNIKLDHRALTTLALAMHQVLTDNEIAIAKLKEFLEARVVKELDVRIMQKEKRNVLKR